MNPNAYVLRHTADPARDDGAISPFSSQIIFCNNETLLHYVAPF